MKLNLFTVEKLIFQDPKIKEILIKDEKYSSYFKEYFFLKSIGNDQSLLVKLYIKFLDEFFNDQEKLTKLFPAAIKSDINFKKSVQNLIISDLKSDKVLIKTVNGTRKIIKKTSTNYKNLGKVSYNSTAGRAPRVKSNSTSTILYINNNIININYYQFITISTAAEKIGITLIKK